MGRKLSAQEINAQVWKAQGPSEITLFAANAGAGDRSSSAIRRALQLPVSPRVWHRVFPHLPREQRADGSLLLWHPHEQGWREALDRVHANLPINGRKRGAYVLEPGTDHITVRDFHEFDELDLPDWSIAVPDESFSALCGRLQGQLCPLSEVVARWAVEVGPVRAGVALAVRVYAANPSPPARQH